MPGPSADAPSLGIEDREPRSTQASLPESIITILPPRDVLDTLRAQEKPVQVTMLDPWYNRGIGGVREDYTAWLTSVVSEAARFSDHVFVWGFPEIVARFLPHIPTNLELTAWLTWYFKNCPSVIRGWRSAQQACLHLAKPGAPMYPGHFLNEKQVELQRQKKLRYMPGPASVIEVPLNIGFVGRAEQTGHPSQKPEAVFEPLFQMTTVPGDTILDPMCGSGTTGAVCRRLGRNAILCDVSAEYTTLAAERLNLPQPI
jgi:site-specific DNA-methyltransferase (adenine-specific)